jgi:hypothetical protein
MFNDSNNSSQGGAKEIDDIFSDIDQPTTPQAPTPPVNPGFQGSVPVAPTPQVNQASPQSPFPGSGKETFLRMEDNMPAAGERGTKALKIFLILLIVVAILSFAGYFVYTKFVQPKAQVVSQINADEVSTPSDEEQALIEQNIKNQEQQASNIPSEATTTSLAEETPLSTPSSSELIVPEVVNVDTDGDGLNDQEETMLGTDITKVDSDGDELSDYEEVKTYLTNPLIVDTDGDTYSDGGEVKGGYNPNGTGKLTTSPAN